LLATGLLAHGLFQLLAELFEAGQGLLRALFAAGVLAGLGHLAGLVQAFAELVETFGDGVLTLGGVGGHASADQFGGYAEASLQFLLLAVVESLSDLLAGFGLALGQLAGGFGHPFFQAFQLGEDLLLLLHQALGLLGSEGVRAARGLVGILRLALHRFVDGFL